MEVRQSVVINFHSQGAFFSPAIRTIIQRERAIAVVFWSVVSIIFVENLMVRPYLPTGTVAAPMGLIRCTQDHTADIVISDSVTSVIEYAGMSMA